MATEKLTFTLNTGANLMNTSNTVQVVLVRPSTGSRLELSVSKAEASTILNQYPGWQLA